MNFIGEHDAWITVGLLLGLLTLAALGDGLRRILRHVRILPTPDGPVLGSAGSEAGLRLLLALAGVPWIVLLLDHAGIPIRQWSLIGAAAVIQGIGRWTDYRARPGSRDTDAVESVRGPRSGHRSIAEMARSAMGWIADAPAAAVLHAAAASLVIFSLIQVSFIPVRSYDALVGYDLVGKVMAYEGRYLSSVFERIFYNAQCVYAPFTAANNGFWYIFHPTVPRLWVPLLAAGFLLWYHARLRAWAGSATAAALGCFLVFLPTSFLYQLTVAQTDLPAMVYTTMAIFALLDLLRGGGGYAPVALFALIATTARTEGVLFGAAFALVVALRRTPRTRHAFWLVAVPAVYFVYWNWLVVQGLMGYDPSRHFLGEVPLDPARAWEVVRRAIGIIGMRSLFGELGWLILATVACWGLWRFMGRKRFRLGPVDESAGFGRVVNGSGHGINPPDTRPTRPGHETIGPDSEITGTVLAILAVMFIFYMPYFYMWDPVYNPLWTMEHTFKRGFFRFIPGLLAAFLCLPPIRQALSRCESAGPAASHEGPSVTRRGGDA